MFEFELPDNSEYLKIAEDLKNIAEERKQNAAVGLINRSIKGFSTGTFSLAVLGMVKRGKSTFCNALLGADTDRYAPIGKTPVSNAITFFEKGSPDVAVSFFSGEECKIQINEIPNYITEQLNPGNKKQVSHIWVKDNFSKLPEGVVLMDTPGEGSFNQHHDDLLYKYLPKVDAGIFLMTAYSPLTESELTFLQEIAKNDVQKIFFAINRVDQVDEDELNEAIEHNMLALAQIGISVGKIYPISAKKAIDGNWTESGMEDLFRDINAYLEKEKFKVPRLRFLNRIAPVVGPLLNGINAEIEARTKNADELKKEIEELTAQGTSLEEKQNKQIEKLNQEWIAAENALPHEIDDAISYIDSQMAAYIESIGIFNCINAKKEFCAKFVHLSQGVISSVMGNFERKIENAVQDIPIQFSGLNFSPQASSYSNFLMRGANTEKLKIAMTGFLGALGLLGWGGIVFPIVGIGIHLHNLSSIKSDLRQQLPVVLKDIQTTLHKDLAKISEQREIVLNELKNIFQMELDPTVQALQDALESQGNIDKNYDEKLHLLADVLMSLNEKINSLYGSLES